MSMKLTPAAEIFTTASFAFGLGTGMSTSVSASGPPVFKTWIAFIVVPRGVVQVYFPTGFQRISIFHPADSGDAIVLFGSLRPLQNKRETLASGNFLVALIEAAMNERDDPTVRLTPAFPHRDHLGLNSDRVAMKQRLRESDVVPTEI